MFVPNMTKPNLHDQEEHMQLQADQNLRDVDVFSLANKGIKSFVIPKIDLSFKKKKLIFPKKK